MKGRQLSENLVEVTGENYVVLYSDGEPCAVYDKFNAAYFHTERGPQTQKRIARWLAGRSAESSKAVHTEEVKRMVEEME